MGKLTALGIRNLKTPGSYSDGGGLVLRFRGAGRGEWILRAQVDQKRKDIRLGGLADVSLAQARELAFESRKQLRAGELIARDVAAARRAARAAVPSFKEAANEVHAEHKSAWKNGKHQDQWIRTLEVYVFPRFGDRPVSDIGGPDIRDALATIWLTKPETARRVRQRIATVLDWACAKGYRATEAPMRSIMRGLPRQPRKAGHFAALPFEDVPEFMASLQERCSVGRLALEFLILTAARSGEVRGCRWNEIDLEKALWTVPKERMKAGKTHIVPLSGPAIDVLRRAQVFKVPATNLVFPGQNLRTELSDMTLLKILRDKKLDATAHGFRSSFRDWVAEETSFQGEVAEAALAHTIQNKVEAAYRRTDYLEKRKSLMRDWGNFCCPALVEAVQTAQAG